MGCLWSSESSKRCSRCNCKETRDSCFVNNKCRRCIDSEESFRTNTIRYQEYLSRYESTYIPTVNRSVRVVSPQPEPKLTIIRRPSTTSIPKPSTTSIRRPITTSIPKPSTTSIRRPITTSIPKPSTTSIPKPSDKSQFGKFYCKECGRSWASLRSWSKKYQMCKNCKKPVYPHILRETLPSDYTHTEEDSKEHERELCQMCKQLGYHCKLYDKK